MLAPDIFKDLPFSVDYRFLGPLLERMAHSRHILSLLRKEMKRLTGNKSEGKSVCVFGSVARGEADLQFSDIDLMFICYSQAERKQLLMKLVKSNRCLEFHGALGLLAGDRDKAKNALDLRFPCIQPDSICATKTETDETRRLQLLLESVPVLGSSLHEEIIRKIIQFYGLEPRRKIRETPEAFMVDLEKFFDRMTKETARRENKGSDFFAKYFIVRKIGQHFTRLGLVQAIFSKQYVLESEHPASGFARILRQSALQKLFFWASSEFLSTRTIARLENNHMKAVRKMLREALEKVGLNVEVTNKQVSLKELLFRKTFDIAFCYSSALDLLHSPDLRKYLENSNPSVTNWETDPNLKQVHLQAKKTIEKLQVLAECLAALFRVADEASVFNKPYKDSGLEVASEYFREKFENQ